MTCLLSQVLHCTSQCMITPSKQAIYFTSTVGLQEDKFSNKLDNLVHMQVSTSTPLAINNIEENTKARVTSCHEKKYRWPKGIHKNHKTLTKAQCWHNGAINLATYTKLDSKNNIQPIG